MKISKSALVELFAFTDLGPVIKIKHINNATVECYIGHLAFSNDDIFSTLDTEINSLDEHFVLITLF